MALLTSYSAANKVVLQGKTQRITCGTPSEPVVSFKQVEGENPTLSSDVWYEMTCHSTASFKYVGMDYSAASACRDAMIKKFTRLVEVWKFDEGSYNEETKTYHIGWVKQPNGATVQEAEVQLAPEGGHMYQVTVNVDCCDVKYTTNPSGTTFAYPACMADVQ